MPFIIKLRDGIDKYIRQHGLSKKWEKAKKLFENDPSHPSLNTELLEPKHRRIYSFRLDKKYRVIFICLPENKVEIIAVTKHYRKWTSHANQRLDAPGLLQHVMARGIERREIFKDAKDRNSFLH